MFCGVMFLGQGSNSQKTTPDKTHKASGFLQPFGYQNITLTGGPMGMQAEGARGFTASGVVDSSRQPTIEIAADHEADYEVVAKVLSRAKNASLVKVSFVEPG